MFHNFIGIMIYSVGNRDINGIFSIFITATQCASMKVCFQLLASHLQSGEELFRGKS